MKLTWSPDKKSVILIAETQAEKSFADLLCADLNAHKYAETKTTAKWSIIPEENMEKLLVP